MTITEARPEQSARAVVPDDKVPDGPLADKWDRYIADSKLVNPNNKRKFKILVVGTGLAGASAAATLAELGYEVEAFTFHDSPRRVPTRSRPRAASTRRRTTAVTATASTGCSTTRSRVATSVHARATCIGSPSCR